LITIHKEGVVLQKAPFLYTRYTMEQSSNKGLLIGTIVVAVLIFLGLIWAVLSVPNDGGTTPLPSGQVSFNDENDPSIGPDDAKVVVRLFEDLECPACKAAEPGVSYAIEKYSDRVRFIWNDFPLDSIHRNARAGANAARCAEEQGKFWNIKAFSIPSRVAGWIVLILPNHLPRTRVSFS